MVFVSLSVLFVQSSRAWNDVVHFDGAWKLFAAGKELPEELKVKSTDNQTASGLKADFTKRLQIARTEYWSRYPDKDGHEHARLALSAVLLEKDLAYLSLYIGEGTRKLDRNPLAMLNKMTGEIDGGIPIASQKTYAEWVQSIRTALGAKGDQMLYPPRKDALEKAIRDAGPIYEKYMTDRDKEEFRLARVPIAGYDPVEWYFTCLFVERRPWETVDPKETRRFGVGVNAYDEARESWNTLKTLFGEEHLIASVKLVQSTPQTATAFLNPMASPAEYGLWVESDPLNAISVQLCSGSPRNFFLGVIRLATKPTGGDNPHNFYWQYYHQEYKKIVERFGEAAVNEVATRVRDAEKEIEELKKFNIRRLRLAHNETLSCNQKHDWIYVCAMSYLQREHPQAQPAQKSDIPAAQPTPQDPPRRRRGG